MHAEIGKAVETLDTGGTLLYPTDTIWGLGSDATRVEAIEKVASLKDRPIAKTFLVLVADDAMLNRYVEEVPALAWDLIDLSEKPLTIIYSNPVNLPEVLLAEDGSLGIRIVKDIFCQRLIQKLGRPIVSTSANRSGMPSPQSFADIDSLILDGVDYVVNLRQQEKQTSGASSIIKLALNGEIKIIRE
ncbi:MAG: L-threonylcarbamoyladenylate synthase [Salibacteraceae bacterium]